eukprot:793946-Prorocentrum_minimum.AAC.4
MKGLWGAECALAVIGTEGPAKRSEIRWCGTDPLRLVPAPGISSCPSSNWSLSRALPGQAGVGGDTDAVHVAEGASEGNGASQQEDLLPRRLPAQGNT